MQKTPDKLEKSISVDNEKTPKKVPAFAAGENKNACTPLKEIGEPKSFEFRTPEKTTNDTTPVYESPESQINEKKTPEKQVSENKTPEKREKSFHLKSEQIISSDGEDEMISTTEQARLLIAASKTPSKSVDKTPGKQNTPSGKRSAGNSPVTPGKFRRVELITLASPKAKRIKQL